MSSQPPPTPAPRPERPQQPSTMSNVGRSLKSALYVVVAVITTIFLLSNSQTVEVDFVVATIETPLFIALSVAVVLGAILALGAVGMRKVRAGKGRSG